MSPTPFKPDPQGRYLDASSAAARSSAAPIDDKDDPGGYASLTFASILAPSLSTALPATSAAAVGPTPQLSPPTSLSSSSPGTSFELSEGYVQPPQDVGAWSPGLPSPALSGTTHYSGGAFGSYTQEGQQGISSVDYPKQSGLGAPGSMYPFSFPSPTDDGHFPSQPPVFLSTAPDGSLQYFVWSYPAQPFAPDAPWITHPPSSASTPVHDPYAPPLPALGPPVSLPTGSPYSGPPHSFPGTPIPFGPSPPAGSHLSLPTPFEPMPSPPWAPHASPHTAPSSPTAPFYPSKVASGPGPPPFVPSQEPIGWLAYPPPPPVKYMRRVTGGRQLSLSVPTGPSNSRGGGGGNRGSQARGRGRGRGPAGGRVSVAPPGSGSGDTNLSNRHARSEIDGGPRVNQTTLWSMSPPGPPVYGLGFTPAGHQTYTPPSLYVPSPAPPGWNDSNRHSKRRGSYGPPRAPRNVSGGSTTSAASAAAAASSSMPAPWPSPQPDALPQQQQQQPTSEGGPTTASSAPTAHLVGGGPPFVGHHHARAAGPHPLPRKPSVDFAPEGDQQRQQQQQEAMVV